MVGKKLENAKRQVAGLEQAIQDAVKKDAKSGTFELDGVTYSYSRGKAKSYDITAAYDGLQYTGDPMEEGFEAALEAALAEGSSFAYGGEVYAPVKQGSSWLVYRLMNLTPAKVYSRLTFSTYEVGASVPDSMRVAALLATGGDGAFEAEGQSWTIERRGVEWVISSASGGEFMELTPYAVRRYNGDDTMEYSLKEALTEKTLEMVASGAKTGTIVHDLPMQTETGEYVYDESGNLSYQETELKLSQRDTGEFVVNCQQIIYVINMFDTPSRAHWLGTDGDGFDVFSRIMYGGRVSLMVGFVVVFLETFLGVIMGGLSGYYGGWVDMFIMRLVDIFYCLPSLPIMIILGAMMDALRMDTYIRLMIMMAALGIMGWAGVARLVRGQILTLREQEFMVATEATGIKVKDRIFHHLVPNIMPQLIVQATMGMGGVILTESTLSFLGLGVKHPLATWGTIINSVSSASAMQHYAFIWIPVGLLICV
ncbi:MAG: ABC transporter permease, partial [Clostridia bacterium]|nr:ABC transporter permease [Clostridia bacterium]